MKIYGKVYHMGTASLLSEKNPRHGQVYIYDGDIALKLRYACGITDSSILQTIENLLHRINPYAKLYKTLYKKLLIKYIV